MRRELEDPSSAVGFCRMESRFGLYLVVSRRSLSLNLSGMSRVSRLSWTILVCTQALLFQTGPSWADPFRVVAVGASNTSGWTVSSEKAYPQVLEQMLRTAGYDVLITNSGRAFDTTAGMLARLDSAVPNRSDLVILQPGANDGRFFVSAERRANNIAAIIRHLRGRQIAVILFDPAFPDNYYSFDRIHFTPDAHAKIAADLMPKVIKEFERIRSLQKAGRPSPGRPNGLIAEPAKGKN
jgi:acyl-CoA thioesterase-1